MITHSAGAVHAWAGSAASGSTGNGSTSGLTNTVAVIAVWTSARHPCDTYNTHIKNLTGLIRSQHGHVKKHLTEEMEMSFLIYAWKKIIVVLTWILPTRCPRTASAIVLTTQSHVVARKPIAIVTLANTSTYFSQCSQHVSSPAWDRFSRFTPGVACMAADSFYPLLFQVAFFILPRKRKQKRHRFQMGS